MTLTPLFREVLTLILFILVNSGCNQRPPIKPQSLPLPSVKPFVPPSIGTPEQTTDFPKIVEALEQIPIPEGDTEAAEAIEQAKDAVTAMYEVFNTEAPDLTTFLQSLEGAKAQLFEAGEALVNAGFGPMGEMLMAIATQQHTISFVRHSPVAGKTNMDLLTDKLLTKNVHSMATLGFVQSQGLDLVCKIPNKWGCGTGSPNAVFWHSMTFEISGVKANCPRTGARPLVRCVASNYDVFISNSFSCEGKGTAIPSNGLGYLCNGAEDESSRQIGRLSHSQWGHNVSGWKEQILKLVSLAYKFETWLGWAPPRWVGR